uniref:Ig-like domain-containing protein n=1 Tax=Felis catus TaxID=9685 RepID=A0ABI7YUY8_FELCA
MCTLSLSKNKQVYKESVIKSARFESGPQEAAFAIIDPLLKMIEKNSLIGYLKLQSLLSPFFPKGSVVVHYISLGLGDSCNKGNTFRSNQIQSFFLKRKKREMLLTVPMLILWMQISQVNGQEIKQIPQFLLLQEGDNFTIYCNSSRTLNSLHWYKQRPGGSPILLITLVKSGDVKQERLTAWFGDTRKNSLLHMVATQTADSGVYFCTGAQCSQSTCDLSLNLAVELQEQPFLISL